MEKCIACTCGHAPAERFASLGSWRDGSRSAATIGMCVWAWLWCAWGEGALLDSFLSCSAFGVLHHMHTVCVWYICSAPRCGAIGGQRIAHALLLLFQLQQQQVQMLMVKLLLQRSVSLVLAFYMDLISTIHNHHLVGTQETIVYHYLQEYSLEDLLLLVH